MLFVEADLDVTYFRHRYVPPTRELGTIVIIRMRVLGMNTQGWSKEKKKPHDYTLASAHQGTAAESPQPPRVRVAGFGQVLYGPPLPSRGRCDSSTEICGGNTGEPGSLRGWTWVQLGEEPSRWSHQRVKPVGQSG